MKHHLPAIVLILLFGAPAVADPMEDAYYIVEQTATRDQYEGAFAGMADLMLGNLQNEVAKNGETISDDAADVAIQLLTAHMTDALLEGMREPLAKAYVYNLSPDALEAYRAFLETPEGQEVSMASGALMRESLKIGEQLGARIAGPAVAAMQDDMRNENWPAGTLKSTQFELRALFGLPPVSEMPPER
jgi:Uncharacterized protein conserved in bacteria (DUF2059)